MTKGNSVCVDNQGLGTFWSMPQSHSLKLFQQCPLLFLKWATTESWPRVSLLTSKARERLFPQSLIQSPRQCHRGTWKTDWGQSWREGDDTWGSPTTSIYSGNCHWVTHTEASMLRWLEKCGVNTGRAGGRRQKWCHIIRRGHSINLDVENWAKEGRMESHYKKARKCLRGKKQREG